MLFSVLRRISVALVSCLYVAAFTVQAQPDGTASYRSDYAAYQSACETLPRPNVDCACVAKAHATWAHMAPDRAYAQYLLELYRQRLGLPSDADARLEAYFNQDDAKDELNFRASIAFESVDHADPFRDDSVKGCVIPGASRPQLDVLPAGTFYEEVYPKMLASLGDQRFVQCELIETSKLMSVDAFEARTRVGNLAAPTSTKSANEVGAQVMGLQLQRFDELVGQANTAYAKAGITTRDPGAYCSALLAAEDSSGELKDRYVRNAAERAGPPVGLANVDVTNPRPAITNTLNASVVAMQASAQAAADQARAENAEALAELQAIQAGGSPIGASQTEVADLEKELKEMQAGVEAQMAVASSAGSTGPSQAELWAACERSGMGSAFCACFTPRFVDEIVPIAGSSAYMLAASALPEGFDPMQSIAFAQTMDMGVLMNVSPKVDALVDACD
ncbi:hypothetical protein R0137_08430 [Congregibacter brevis]|uniref:Uncharacterized protein n=1 Tax=Congregibacter brevis TaxID=3081201 RepID=A0ABZ0IHT3_9GAMM|nr:hypothetical protein R0137_08430 [Congregibacter sp. IMCC45268]